ncbi:MAG: sugar phosphate isomerase/epimerase family protein [Candidatus Baldrarchaeia archaeon]
MEFGISTCFMGNISESLLHYIKELGISHVEICFVRRTDVSRSAAIKIAKMAYKMDFGVTIHAPFMYEFMGTPSLYVHRGSKQDVKVLMRSLEIAAIAGAELLVVHDEPFRPYSLESRIFFSAISELALEGEKEGIVVTVENCWQRVGYLVKEIESCGIKSLGLCLDLGHANIHMNPAEAIRVASPVLCHVHIHDNRGKSDEHLPPRRGTIDWYAVMSELLKIGYSGICILEVNEPNHVLTLKGILEEVSENCSLTL